ncbi:MATE efflux family protein [Clostridiales bacterium KLE1615]|nr:MATE efflux family protein [Clostridiales bacterium KLE1615]
MQGASGGCECPETFPEVLSYRKEYTADYPPVSLIKQRAAIWQPPIFDKKQEETFVKKKSLYQYIAPNILAMVGMSCYILADTFFIATSQGTNGITALNLALPIYGLIFAIGSMIGTGSAIRYTLAKATGQQETKKYFSNALIWDAIVSVIFIAAGLFFPGQVMRVMGADAVIEAIGIPYIRIVLCFTPFFMMNYAFTAFVRNDNAPHIAMAATLLSSLFNIVFDYVFMFPLGMGMTGAALATAVSPIVSILICMVHYLSPKSSVAFHFMVPSVKMLISSCSLGVVAFVGEIASAVTTMVFNFVLLGLDGNTAVAAYGVIANTALVGTAIFNGVSQGLQPLASEAHARGEEHEKHQILIKSIVTGIILSIVLIGGVWFFASDITSAFNSEHSAQLAAYAIPGIRIYFIGFFAAGINIICAGFLSATDHAKESSIVAISRGIIAIIIFALVLPTFLGITGVWLAFPAAEAVTLLLAIFMTKRISK